MTINPLKNQVIKGREKVNSVKKEMESARNFNNDKVDLNNHESEDLKLASIIIDKVKRDVKLARKYDNFHGDTGNSAIHSLNDKDDRAGHIDITRMSKITNGEDIATTILDKAKVTSDSKGDVTFAEVSTYCKYNGLATYYSRYEEITDKKGDTISVYSNESTGPYDTQHVHTKVEVNKTTGEILDVKHFNNDMKSKLSEKFDIIGDRVGLGTMIGGGIVTGGITIASAVTGAGNPLASMLLGAIGTCIASAGVSAGISKWLKNLVIEHKSNQAYSNSYIEEKKTSENRGNEPEGHIVLSNKEDNLQKNKKTAIRENQIEKQEQQAKPDLPYVMYSKTGKSIAEAAFRDAFDPDADTVLPSYRSQKEVMAVMKNAFEAIIASSDTTEEEKSLAKLGLVCNRVYINKALHKTNVSSNMAHNVATCIAESIARSFHAPPGFVIGRTALDGYNVLGEYLNQPSDGYNVLGEYLEGEDNISNIRQYGEIQKTFLKEGFEGILNNPGTTENEKSLAKKGLEIYENKNNTVSVMIDEDTLKKLENKLSPEKLNLVRDYLPKSGPVVTCTKKCLTEQLTSTDVCQIDDKTIEKLKDKIPSARLETLNKHKGVYRSKESIDDAFKPFPSYYDQADTFNNEELELIKNNVTISPFTKEEVEMVINNAIDTTDIEVAKNMSFIMNSMISSKPEHGETEYSTGREVITEVNRIRDELKSLAGNRPPVDGEIEIFETRTPTGIISGNLEFDKETGKLKHFSGHSRLLDRKKEQYRLASSDVYDDDLWVRYGEEQSIKLTEDSIKNLEGKINVDPLKPLLNMEFNRQEFDYKLQRAGLRDEEIKYVEQYSVTGEIYEKYNLDNASNEYTVLIDKDGTITVRTREK